MTKQTVPVSKNINRTIVFSLLLLSGTVFSGSMKTAAQDETSYEETLALECHDIPKLSDKLCLLKTQSPFGPVDDVVFYKKDKDGHMTFLSAVQGSIAVVYFDSFSKGGKFLVIGEAEEGHPNFIVHSTARFLNPGTGSSIVGSIYNYYITHLDQILDDGTIIHSVMEGGDEPMPACIDVSTLEDIYDKDTCHIVANIYDAGN